MDIGQMLKKFNSQLRFLSPVSLPVAYIDLALSAALFGASQNDYIRYRFWEKSLRERNTFITHFRSKQTIKRYNSRGDWRIFEDKARFNEKFSSYVHRDWLNLQTASEEEFVAFLRRNEKFLIKPVNGGQGKGISFINGSDVSKDFLDRHKGYLAEEVIIQHSELAGMNPSSVNTLRISTLNKNGKIVIVSAALRTGGADAFTDNISTGGLCAAVDLETGIVVSKGINYAYERFVCHPATAVAFPGFRIPNWECVLRTATECAQLVPDVGYIGWDIAVTEEGCELIEGNHDPGHGVMQMADQVGKWPLIKD